MLSFSYCHTLKFVRSLLIYPENNNNKRKIYIGEHVERVVTDTGASFSRLHLTTTTILSNPHKTHKNYHNRQVNDRK